MDQAGENNDGLEQFIVDLLKKIAEDQGFINFELVPYPGTKMNDGFMSYIQGITIDGERVVEENGEPVKDKLSVLAKMPPSCPMRREQFNSVGLFQREAYVYKNILPEIEQFQRDKGITTPEEGFFGFPKCYGIIDDDEKNQYVLVMEDIRPNGFKMRNKFESVNVEHVKKVLNGLAKLHAVTYALKHEDPGIMEKFHSLPDFFGIGVKAEPDKMKMFFTAGMEKAIESLGPHEEFFREKMSTLLENSLEVMEHVTGYEAAEPFAVVNHGDSWSNNMLFHYGDESETPNDIIFVDWQISRYSSPILDIMYFMYTCTDDQLRNNHWIELMKYYHTSFTEMLQRLSYDGKPFTFGEMKRHLKLFGKYGVCMAQMLLQIMCSDPELIDMSNVAEQMKTSDSMSGMELPEKSLLMYNDRMSSVIRHAVRMGYL